MNIALLSLLHNHRQYRARRKHEVKTMTYSYRITPKVIYSAQYHRHHYTLRDFEQFGTLYMHNLDDKHPTGPGFEPSTSEFRVTAGSNKDMDMDRINDKL